MNRQPRGRYPDPEQRVSPRRVDRDPVFKHFAAGQLLGHDTHRSRLG